MILAGNQLESEAILGLKSRSRAAARGLDLQWLGSLNYQTTNPFFSSPLTDPASTALSATDLSGAPSLGITDALTGTSSLGYHRSHVLQKTHLVRPHDYQVKHNEPVSAVRQPAVQGAKEYLGSRGIRGEGFKGRVGRSRWVIWMRW